MFVAKIRDLEAVVEFVLNHVGDCFDLVVLVVRPHVVDVLSPRLGVEGGVFVRAGGVPDVDEGPPVAAVAVDGQRAVRERAEHEVVHDEVEADARRVAVVRAHAECGGVEAVLVLSLTDAGFGVVFCFRIRIQRVGVDRLVDVSAGRSPVEVARGREYDVLDAEFAGGAHDVLRALVVDVERFLAALVGAVSTRDGRKVDDGVRVPHGVFDVAVLADVAPLEVQAVGRPEPDTHEIAWGAGGEIVEDRDVLDVGVGFREQLWEQRTADVATAPRH